MCVETQSLSPFLSLSLSLLSVSRSIHLSLLIPSQPLIWTWFSFYLHYDFFVFDFLFFLSFGWFSFFFLDSCFQMFEDEHRLEGAGCGSAERGSLPT